MAEPNIPMPSTAMCNCTHTHTFTTYVHYTHVYLSRATNVCLVHCDLKHMKQTKVFFFLCQIHLTVFVLQSDRAETSFLGLIKFSALFKVCITFHTSKGLAYASFLLGHLSESPRFWLMSLKDIFILAVTSIFIICVNKLIFTNFLQP